MAASHFPAPDRPPDNPVPDDPSQGPTAPGEEPTADFAALLTGPGQELLTEVRDYTAGDELALATRLRRRYPAGLVAAALAQARLRQRAVSKFGPDAWRMYFTGDGLEQATRTGVADWRAQRFRALGVTAVADLCCGIGGDAIALARAGLTVLAVDRSAVTCAVARANAEALGLAGRIEVRCAEVTETDISDWDAVFIDPARRASAGAGGRAARTFDPAAYSPPLDWAVEVAGRVSHAALKIGPGVPHEALPLDAEAEWVSDARAVKEAVLWFDDGIRPGGRRATLLPGGDSLTGLGLPDPEPGPVGRYLYEPDGAVIRAHLVAEVARELGARLLDPDIAYLTSDHPGSSRYATGYQIDEVLPFSLKRLKALVRERHIGTLTIKKRGFAMTPEELRRKLKLKSGGAGQTSATLFLTRIQGAPTMLLGQPLSDRQH